MASLMKSKQRSAAIVLLLLLGATVYAMVRTRSAEPTFIAPTTTVAPNPSQPELDQDEVDEAKQDLTHAGGDPQGRIQAMLEQHEAASHSSDSTHVTVNEPPEAHGLIHRFQRWSELHQKQLQLWRAKHDAEATAASLAAKHVALEKQVNAQRPQFSQSSPVQGPAAGKRAECAPLANSTSRRAGHQKMLTILD